MVYKFAHLLPKLHVKVRRNDIHVNKCHVTHVYYSFKIGSCVVLPSTGLQILIKIKMDTSLLQIIIKLGANDKMDIHVH